jgi:two-component system chemotaxis response regulator CheY
MEGTSKTILVCDDSLLARKHLMDAIKGSDPNFIFYEGCNGLDAVKLYKEHKPDLVFLDIVMPEKDGTEAVKEIRAFDPGAMVIIVSSVGTQSQLKEAIDAGAKDFIQKPFDTTQIHQLINKYTGGSK